MTYAEIEETAAGELSSLEIEILDEESLISEDSKSAMRSRSRQSRKPAATYQRKKRTTKRSASRTFEEKFMENQEKQNASTNAFQESLLESIREQTAVMREIVKAINNK